MPCIFRSVGGAAAAPAHANDNFESPHRIETQRGCVATASIPSSDDLNDIAMRAGNAIASFGVARNRIDPRDLFDFDITIPDHFHADVSPSSHLAMGYQRISAAVKTTPSPLGQE